jgi:methyl-accepting chemotaxis protein
MRNQLRDTVSQLVQTSQQLDGAARDVAEGASQVASSSDRQSEAASSMAAAVEQLSTSLSVSAERSVEAISCRRRRCRNQVPVRRSSRGWLQHAKHCA